MPVLLLIFGLLMFVVLVVVHEWGHYLAARRNGIEVEEFGIGFPPKLKTLKRRHGTEFTLNLLPLGGFVKLKGEHDADTAKGSYGAASLKAKVKVMLAGVGMNLLTAFVLLTILAATGLPKLLDNQFTIASDTKIVSQKVLIAGIEKDSPAGYTRNAAGEGLKEIDELKRIERDDVLNDCDVAKCVYEIATPEDVAVATKALAGEESLTPVKVIVERDGKELEFDIKLRTKKEVEAARQEGKATGYLGVVPGEYTVQRSTWSAPIVAAGFIVQGTAQTLQGIGSALASLFTGDAAKAGEQVSGPVGIFTILQRGSNIGLGFVIMIVALISLTLAIMNALPIPALDGGRLFVTLLYRVLRKPLTPKAEEWIHGTGFTLLMLLFVVITIVDIKRL